MSSEQRLHPYSIIFAFLAQIRIFILPGVFVVLGVGRGSEWWQPWMMLLIVPAVAGAVLRYLTYQFRYEANELVIRTGLVFRKERHIPYARIQNIDAEQNVLHRLLNVVEIRIETGGGRSAEATMSVLPVSALADMRQRVFTERRAVAAETEAGAPAAVEGDVLAVPSAVEARTLLELDLRELLLCGFIENRGAVLIAAGFGVAWEAGVIDRFVFPVFGGEIVGRGAMRDFLRSVVSEASVLWDRMGIMLAAFAGLMLLIRVLSMAWAAVRLYGFKLALIDGDARTEFGLLTRVAMTIPLRRVQSLTVKEGPLHRLFSRVAVKVDTAGGRVDQQNQQNEREYLAPILPVARLDDFAQSIVGVSVAGVSWQPLHPRAFRREVKGWLFVALLISAALWFYFGGSALLVAPFAAAWAVVGARQTVRHMGWAVTEDAVLFKSGWLWKRVVVARFAKIQVVRRHDNAFDRRTGMSRLFVDTAGASAGSFVSIPYIPAGDAEALYRQLAREAATRPFTW